MGREYKKMVSLSPSFRYFFEDKIDGWEYHQVVLQNHIFVKLLSIFLPAKKWSIVSVFFDTYEAMQQKCV